MKSIEDISKITPPLIPPVLDRPRLIDLLEKNKDKKLTLILGQAAQGKTTLAVSYVKASNIPAAWMNLEEKESDPFNLYTLMLRSLQHALKETDFSHLLSYRFETMGLRAEIPIFREWVHSLFDLIQAPVQIVMDGLERLDAHAPAFQLLQIFIDDMPPNFRLFLLSREIPPLSLEFQNLKIRQEALVLKNDELAFTLNEIGDFFYEHRRLSLQTDQLIRISRMTEGWVGGLILLSECLHLPREDSRKQNILKEIPDRFREEVFQYLGKEIFSSQTEQIREFLVKSSILDSMEPAFMAEFIGMENAGDLLRTMMRRNLFVHSVGDKNKGWLFRYHQLLRDFLRVKFETEVGSRERQILFLKAGHLYEQRGELPNAIKYFLDGKAYPQAASVLARLGMGLIKQGRKGDLSAWISALPEDVIAQNPWLLFYRAMARRFVGVKANIADLQKAFREFTRNENMQGQILSLAYLIENLIYGGHYTIPVGPLIKQGEKILSSLGKDLYPFERAVLWVQIGLGNMRVEGKIRQGIFACQTAYMIARQLKDINLQIHALILLVFGFAALGEFVAGEEAEAKIEKIVGKSMYPETESFHLLASSVLFVSKGNWKEAENFILRLENSVEKFGLVYLHPMVLSLRFLLTIHLKKFGDAEEIGKRLSDLSRSLGNLFIQGLSFELLGQCHYQRGNFRIAQNFIRKAMAIFSSTQARSDHHLNRSRQIMGLVCFHRKDYLRAEKELQESLNYFMRISSYPSIAGNHLALAILGPLHGKGKETNHHLQAGFKLAEEKKYEQCLILSSEDLLKACLLALELHPSAATEYAARLLCTHLASVAEKELETLANDPDFKIQEKVWEIRRKIHRSQIPILRIETLGRFRVFRGNSLIEENEWDRNQPKRLLRAIVSYNHPSIPKDILMEYICPEAAPNSAEKIFKTTLQRLRSSLEPVIDRNFSSAYVHLHDGCISLDPELCQVDADLFLSLVKRGEENERKGNLKAAVSLYYEAAELYKGDFLPEESYSLWADMKREELRGLYINLLIRTAKYHEKHGASIKAIACHKKAIQADRLLEDSYRSLMNLYANIGMRNEALRAYEECKRALQTGLDSSPDPMTTSLYRRILEKGGAAE